MFENDNGKDCTKPWHHRKGEMPVFFYEFREDRRVKEPGLVSGLLYCVNRNEQIVTVRVESIPARAKQIFDHLMAEPVSLSKAFYS